MNSTRFIEMSETEAADYLAWFSESSGEGFARFQERLSGMGVSVSPKGGLPALQVAWAAVRDQFQRRERESPGVVPDWCYRTTTPRVPLWSDDSLWLFDGLVHLANAAVRVEDPRSRWGRDTYLSSTVRNYPCLLVSLSESDERQYVGMEHIVISATRYVRDPQIDPRSSYIVRPIYEVVLGRPLGEGDGEAANRG